MDGMDVNQLKRGELVGALYILHNVSIPYVDRFGVLWAVDRLNKLKRGEPELGNLQWSPMFLPHLLHILHMLHQTGLDVWILSFVRKN